MQCWDTVTCLLFVTRKIWAVKLRHSIQTFRKSPDHPIFLVNWRGLVKLIKAPDQLSGKIFGWSVSCKSKLSQFVAFTFLPEWQNSKECMCCLQNISTCDYQEIVTTDRHIHTDTWQSDPEVILNFTGDTKTAVPSNNSWYLILTRNWLLYLVSCG